MKMKGDKFSLQFRVLPNIFPPAAERGQFPKLDIPQSSSLEVHCIILIRKENKDLESFVYKDSRPETAFPPGSIHDGGQNKGGL